MKTLIIVYCLAGLVALCLSSSHTISEPAEFCLHLGQKYGPGDIPFSRRLPCHHCDCRPDHVNSTLVRKWCVIADCGLTRELCLRKSGFKSVIKRGLCCPVCEPILCQYNKKVFKQDDIVPHRDPCKECICDNGQIHCLTIDCDVPACPGGKAPEYLPRYCCPVCPW